MLPLELEAVMTAVLFAAVASACTDDASCSFNGVCSIQRQAAGAGAASAACQCVPGWKGSACEQLDLADAAGTGRHFTGATAGLNLLDAAGNFTSTWGGSVVKGADGDCTLHAAASPAHLLPPAAATPPPPARNPKPHAWRRTLTRAASAVHMFAAMMVGHCGINAWLQNSVVLHAVSPSADGAYTPKQIVAPVFSHEPIAVVAPGGELAVFYTTTVQLHRTPTIAKTCTDCTDGNSSMDCAPDWDARGRDWKVPLPTCESISGSLCCVADLRAASPPRA